MNQTILFRQLGLAALGLLFTPAAFAAPRRTVTIAYFADIHGQLEEHPELFWNGGREEIATAGGAARIAAVIERWRKERPGQLLFFDAGDTFQGSGPAAWTQGAVVSPVLNALGLDLGLPGNWEVVYGPAALRARARELRHPLIAANVFDQTTGERLFAPYKIEDRNGVRVAIVGYTDPDVPRRQPPSYSAGLRYAGVDVLQPLIDEIRSGNKADIVLLLTHIGLPKAVRLAEMLKGVDVVLSGDTHERTYQPIVRGQTWIVEPGSFGSFLGRLDLAVENGRLVDRRWQLVELRSSQFPEDPKVKKMVNTALAPYRERLDRVIGHTKTPLMRYAVVETSLDGVLADAIREAAGADIALSNGFRFAGPVTPGPIREGDLWNFYPVVTSLKVGQVTGRQLREFWEREIENVFSKDPNRLFGGWLPRPSGMNLTFDSSASPGRRVREVLINGRPLADDAVYTVAACDREGDPPDMVCQIPHVQNVKVLALDAHEAVRRYLAAHDPVESSAPGRVVAVDLPSVLRSQFLN
jgi:sulfur-oxidizing protein SoxB